MNKDRRQTLKHALQKLDEASSLLYCVIDDEQDSLENTPENMQDGYRFQEREEYLDALWDVADGLENLIVEWRDKL